MVHSGKHLAFPFHIGNDGRAATVSTMQEQVPQELIQLILTNPGERLCLTDFGGGARSLVFEELDDVTSGLAKARITSAINRWMGHRISLDELNVAVENETISVEIRYRLAGSEESRVMKFQRGGEA